MAELKWVARNEDKPHRCPGCHGIAERAWDTRGYGPRTKMKCLYGCGMRWRPACRGQGFSMRSYQWGFTKYRVPRKAVRRA